jgi:hypothetical protein
MGEMTFIGVCCQITWRSGPPCFVLVHWMNSLIFSNLVKAYWRTAEKCRNFGEALLYVFGE